MADVVVEAAPAAAAPPMQAPPTMRAALAVVLRGLLTLAARTMLRGFLVAMWIVNAANIVRVVARRVSGGGSRVSAVARDVMLVATLMMMVFAPFVFIPLVLCHDDREDEAREFEGGDASVQGRRPESTGGRLRPGFDCGSALMLMYVLCSMVMLVGLTGLEDAVGALASRKESVAAGFRICDKASIGCSFVACFIYIPRLSNQLSDFLRWITESPSDL